MSEYNKKKDDKEKNDKPSDDKDTMNKPSDDKDTTGELLFASMRLKLCQQYLFDYETY